MLGGLLRFVVIAGVLLVVVSTVLLVLVAIPMPRIEEPQDVFGFASLAESSGPLSAVTVTRYPARDGSALAYRFHDSPSDRILVFVHGSSYHGAAYTALAEHLSQAGVAKVVLPNLRGHYLSGRRRGDVDYVGQLEDDIADLIAHLRVLGHDGPVLLGGHSSGGGFAIRFAGGPNADLISGYVLLAPVIPTSPVVRGGDAGGWASLNGKRLAGLIGLGAFGISGFDGLPIIQFNKPEAFWDGTETLTYSYRLNASYHPRQPYDADLAALTEPTLVMVGEDDQALDAHGFEALLARDCPHAEIIVMSGIDHFGIFGDDRALDQLAAWIDEWHPR